MKLFNNKTLWNFPIAKAQIQKVKRSLQKQRFANGYTLYVILILIGFKIFVINGIIFILNFI